MKRAVGSKGGVNKGTTRHEHVNQVKEHAAVTALVLPATSSQLDLLSKRIWEILVLQALSLLASISRQMAVVRIMVFSLFDGKL